MTRRAHQRARLLLAVGVLAAALPGCSDDAVAPRSVKVLATGTPSPPEVETTPAGPGATPLREFGYLYERMRREHLGLFEVRVTFVLRTDDAVIVTVDSVMRLWAPPGRAAQELPPALFARGFATAAMDELAQVQVSSTAIVVASRKAAVLAFQGVVAPGGEFVDGVSMVPMHLKSAGAALRTRAANPPPVPVEECGRAAPPVPPTDRAALVSRFTTVWKPPDPAIAAKHNRINRLADRFAHSVARPIDPVSGQPVFPDINDIARQLREGTPESRLVVYKVVPTSIVFGSPPPGADILVFADHRTGDFLGFVRWQATRTDRVGTEMLAPRSGGPLAVYAKSSRTAYYCSPVTGTPLLVVPYDDFAGPRRSYLDLPERTHHVV